MVAGLWDWQDEDADRLRQEEKRALAECWDNFDPDAEALARAAELARELDEPAWELFYLHWFVQQGLYREHMDLARLVPAANRLSELAESSRVAQCPQRFCARESVFNVRSAIDPPGFAPELRERSVTVGRQVPGELECRGCFELLQVSASIELGELDRAFVLIEEMAQHDQDPNVELLLNLFRAEVHLKKRDVEAMSQDLRWAREALESGESVNPDNEWFLLLLEVEWTLLSGSLEEAVGLAQRARTKPPDSSIEAIRIELALARGFAERGEWESSRERAEKALATAMQRGLTRYATEAALHAAEACQSLEDSEAQRRYARDLERMLPSLGSRDLDERARAIGAEW